MSKRNILLVGAGQLGSRHLQALAKLEEPANIIVVDPSRDSLNISEQRAREIDGWNKHEFSYRQEFGELSAIDFAVVATSANVRRPVIEMLLSSVDVKYMLLEKVLFQRAQDCVEVGALLKKKGTKAWVNAPRRMWSCYQTLKRLLDGEAIQGFVRSGSGWGLACNSYHMLDLFAWLSSRSDVCISSEFVGRQPVPSKREGFFELKGTLTGSFGDEVVFMISDHSGSSKDSYILIETRERLLHVSEKTRELTLVAGDPLPVELADLRIDPEYQSNLTHRVAKQVWQENQCELTPYEEASRLHQKMLVAFAERFNPILKEGDLCPIT